MSRRVVVVLWFLSSSYDEGYRCDTRGGREERGVVRHFVLIGSDFEIAAAQIVSAQVCWHCDRARTRSQTSTAGQGVQRSLNFDGPLNVYGPISLRSAKPRAC